MSCANMARIWPRKHGGHGAAVLQEDVSAILLLPARPREKFLAFLIACRLARSLDPPTDRSCSGLWGALGSRLLTGKLLLVRFKKQVQAQPNVLHRWRFWVLAGMRVRVGNPGFYTASLRSRLLNLDCVRRTALLKDMYAEGFELALLTQEDRLHFSYPCKIQVI